MFDKEDVCLAYLLGERFVFYAAAFVCDGFDASNADIEKILENIAQKSLSYRKLSISLQPQCPGTSVSDAFTF